MHRPVVLQFAEFPDAGQRRIESLFSVHRCIEPDRQFDFAKRHGSEVRAIATRGDIGIDTRVFGVLPKIEIVSVSGVGYDGIETQIVRPNAVSKFQTPRTFYPKRVADFALCMMLSQCRRISDAEDWVRSGRWSGEGPFPLTRRAHGKRAGILGLGAIGIQLARRLECLDMEVAYWNRSEKDVGKNWRRAASPVDLAKQSDFLFVTIREHAGDRANC